MDIGEPWVFIHGEPRCSVTLRRMRSFKRLTSPKVRSTGFEPATGGLEIRCSIHLSYERVYLGKKSQVDIMRDSFITAKRFGDP